MKSWRLALLILWLLLPTGAVAQGTGGSFGGGNWGSGGGNSGGGGGGGGGWSGGSSSGGNWGGNGSSGSWNNNGSRPGSYNSGGGGSALGLPGICCVICIIGVVAAAVYFNNKRKGGGGFNANVGMGGPGAGMGSPMYSGGDGLYVSQLSIAVDWRSRRELQEQLNRLAQTGDTRSPQGLANLLRETVLAMRRAEMAWLYVGFKGLGPFAPQNAQGEFQQLATQARAAFRHELVRGVGGQVQLQQSPEMIANPNEGQGTVVVHLLVAARRPLALLQAPDANQIRMALDNRAALTADQLVALEVVWSPAAENDRMSTAELEQFYPDMRLIDPNSIAGRIFCTYCAGPFPMELLKCPHCGAPAEASRNNRAPPQRS